jgi:hypothetical protein
MNLQQGNTGGSLWELLIMDHSHLSSVCVI